MYKLISKIIIGKYVFDFVSKVEIESSHDKLTDTATITVPNKFVLDGKVQFADPDGLFKVGDPVNIYLGYSPNLANVFNGFISSFKPNRPIEIGCEDHMWPFKRFSMKKSWRNAPLQTILDFIHRAGKAASTWPTVDIPVVSLEDNLIIPAFSINNETGAKAFEKLSKDYGLHVFAYNGSIYCGYDITLTNTQKRLPFNFQANIVAHDLTYKQAQDSKVKIKATSFDFKANKKVEVTVGDEEGEEHALAAYNMSEAALKSWANDQLKQYKYTGYYGSFTAFGAPFTAWGDTVLLTDNSVPDRKGEYLVRSVKYSFGTDGYRQEIELDQKVG